MENMYEGKNIKITIDGKKIEDIIIKKFVLNEEINDHKKLKVEFETEDAEKKKLEEIIKKEDVKLQIELENSQITKKIFKGVIDYFEILDYGSEGCKILIKAFSESIFFDRKLEKRYRVFQDKNWTYADIIGEINKEYKERNLEIKFSEIANIQIGKMIVQYDETDWEFLVRIASHLGTCLFVTEQEIITFGRIEVGNSKKENRFFSNYSAVRDYMNLYYKIYSNNVISIGDEISLSYELNDVEKKSGNNTSENVKKENSQNSFTVIKSNIFLKNYILKSEFLATNINEYKLPIIFNSEIKGSGVEARVEKVFSENGIAKMNVLFYEGLNKIVASKLGNKKSKAYKDYGIERYPLSYQTFYSQTNTGFFCTPEVNDMVEVYFSNEDEQFAKVSWSINNEGNGRFSNYEKRNFHINGSDFNFKVEKDSVTVNIANGYTRNSKTSTKTAENIVSKSEKNTVIVSDDYIGFESIGEMSIYGSDINLIGKEKDIRIETPSEIRIKGRKVHNN